MIRLIMKKCLSLFALLLLISQVQFISMATARQSRELQFTKTPLLSDKEVAALAAEINGSIAKDTVLELSRHHRVQASTGYTQAAQYIASKAKEYGLERVE